MNGEELGWRRECADADALLRHLSLNPEQCRTDGGWLNVARIKTLLAERSPRVALSDEQIDAACKNEPAAVYELMHGHEITVEQFRTALRQAARSVIAEYDRSNSGAVRQPLSEAQIAAVLRKASERAGFVTLEAGEPSAFMVGVVRDVEAAHGITPAQGEQPTDQQEKA